MISQFEIRSSSRSCRGPLMAMAPPQLQEEGWPLGLQPVSARAGLNSGGDRGLISGRSASLSTLITASPASTGSSSSDLDSESTGSLFHERRTTFGRLIGASSSLDLSMRSSATKKSNTTTRKTSRPDLLWSFSVCCRDSSDVEVVKNYGSATDGGGAPPLRHLLAAERRKSGRRRRRGGLGPGERRGPYDGLGLTGLTPEWNSLFVDGRIAPPPQRSSPLLLGPRGDQGSTSSAIFSWIFSRQS